MSIRIFLAIIFGYLFGSIPMGYILGKLRGIDITEKGFRKIGTSNVYRVLGLKYAILAAIFDLSKGIVAILFSKEVLGLKIELGSIAGAAALIGHNWPIWLKFKGEGRGIATATGIGLFLLPEITLIALTVFLVITIFTKSTAPGTPFFLLLLPILTHFSGKPRSYQYLATAIFLITFSKRILGNLQYIKKNSAKLKALLYVIIWDRSQ